ncbi:MAG TPA: MYXO-CTERM sorting domain-containing protein, partial [Myxococcaceae bacterium]|nr:MYXO-CTERM sorting domain-containing protein [Myxococcaceae bacterium]
FTAPDEAATLVFELSVDDGRGGFASEQVEVKLEKAAGGCSSTGSGPGSLAPLLLLGAGLLVSRRRSVRG